MPATGRAQSTSSRSASPPGRRRRTAPPCAPRSPCSRRLSAAAHRTGPSECRWAAPAPAANSHPDQARARRVTRRLTFGDVERAGEARNRLRRRNAPGLAPRPRVATGHTERGRRAPTEPPSTDGMPGSWSPADSSDRNSAGVTFVSRPHVIPTYRPARPTASHSGRHECPSGGSDAEAGRCCPGSMRTTSSSACRVLRRAGQDRLEVVRRHGHQARQVGSDSTHPPRPPAGGARAGT